MVSTTENWPILSFMFDDLQTIISQDVSIFSGTLKSNLDPLDQYTPQECFEVLERCHLTSAFHFTPSAEEPTILDMYISPGSLSAGEKQLVALARAVMRKTNIIIMDEATSQIDTRLDDQVRISRPFSCSLINNV